MDPDEVTLHTGGALPRRLMETVGTWDQRKVTPGWLDSLPTTVADVCARWRIDLDPAIPDTYVTLVLLGHSPVLGPVAIKSSPLADEFRAEATALRLAAGGNVARSSREGMSEASPTAYCEQYRRRGMF